MILFTAAAIPIHHHPGDGDTPLRRWAHLNGEILMVAALTVTCPHQEAELPDLEKELNRLEGVVA